MDRHTNIIYDVTELFSMNREWARLQQDLQTLEEGFHSRRPWWDFSAQILQVGKYTLVTHYSDEFTQLAQRVRLIERCVTGTTE